MPLLVLSHSLLFLKKILVLGFESQEVNESDHYAHCSHNNQSKDQVSADLLNEEAEVIEAVRV